MNWQKREILGYLSPYYLPQMRQLKQKTEGREFQRLTNSSWLRYDMEQMLFLVPSQLLMETRREGETQVSEGKHLNKPGRCEIVKIKWNSIHLYGQEAPGYAYRTLMKRNLENPLKCLLPDLPPQPVGWSQFEMLRLLAETGRGLHKWPSHIPSK